MMPPESVIELALYRVADRMARGDTEREAMIGAALRQVGEEINKILSNRPIAQIGFCAHGIALSDECEKCKIETGTNIT